MSIEKDTFGTTADGIPVDRYTLRNGRGAMVRLITFGATVTELWMPDRQGTLADVV
jgi:aldose 1-epimerase